MRSLPLWREFFASIGRDLFHRTGVLWLSNDQDLYTQQLFNLLGKNQVACEKLAAGEIQRRWPQLHFDDVTWGVLEPESGVLMARNAVQALVSDLIRNGVDYSEAAVLPPRGSGTLAEVTTGSGDSVRAETFIFACGPWLPKIFPDLLKERIFPTRQEVFFLGPPAGSRDFRSSNMPVWLHHTHPDLAYALPDMENRGFKIAFDRHGAEFDPDSGTRVVGPSSLEHLRAYLEKHVPALRHAPVVETRVCQYENTSNGDFLVDRHPGFENVWIAGGGSGHGFKHGPALGEYLSARILHDVPSEPRFSLASKRNVRKRTVY
jgi:glycine/D-amino acid oxidase-like deaminating enzyme